jgi:hypothetical protein
MTSATIHTPFERAQGGAGQSDAAGLTAVSGHPKGKSLFTARRR